MVQGGHQKDTHLAVFGPLVPVLGPGQAIVTVGHLVGGHILDVAEVSGPLRDDASHLFLGAQVNLQKKTKTKTNPPFSLLGPFPVQWKKADTRSREL